MAEAGDGGAGAGGGGASRRRCAGAYGARTRVLDHAPGALVWAASRGAALRRAGFSEVATGCGGSDGWGRSSVWQRIFFAGGKIKRGVALDGFAAGAF